MSFGFKASAGGVAIDKAADWQLALSSDWPLLKILAVVPVSVPNPSPAADNLVYSHGLNYAPAFMVISDGPSPGIDANTLGQTEANMTSSGFYTTSSGLFYDGFFDPFPKGFVVIFEYDIVNTNFIAPVESASEGQPSTQNTIGLEIAAEHHDVSSTNPKDILLTTANRPMQVHMSGSFTQSGLTPVTLSHGLGYLPVYLIYQSLAGKLYLASARATATLQSVTFVGVQAELGLTYYLILKDAFTS
jgi:hypothetical protein